MDEYVERLHSRDLNATGTFQNFEPEVLVPQQFFDKGGVKWPFHELLVAIMDSALVDISGKCTGATAKGKRRIASETADWVLSDDVWAFSFVYCCQHLNYSVDEWREKFMERYAEALNNL